jgi:hypothetical protein
VATPVAIGRRRSASTGRFELHQLRRLRAMLMGALFDTAFRKFAAAF